MKNAFDGLSNSLDTAEERINDLEMSVIYETMQRDRVKKVQTGYAGTMGQLQKVLHMHTRQEEWKKPLKQ